MIDEAVLALKRALAIAPKNILAKATLIATYVEMGCVEEALAERQEL